MMLRQEKSVTDTDNFVLSRRKALARLGLAAAVIYAAPTITRIDGEALAKRKARPSVVCPGGSCDDGGDDREDRRRERNRERKRKKKRRRGRRKDDD